jgi:hypothetical protein
VFGFFGYVVYKLFSADYKLFIINKLKRIFLLLSLNKSLNFCLVGGLANIVFRLSFSRSIFLKMFGMGYYIFLHRTKLYFSLGYSHVLVYCLLKNHSFTLTIVKKKGLFFKSIFAKMGQLILSFKLLKMQDVYLGKGLCLLKSSFYRKVGKTVK